MLGHEKPAVAAADTDGFPPRPRKKFDKVLVYFAGKHHLHDFHRFVVGVA
jgi:hypothetical protein